MKITWFGHSAFRVEIPGAVLLIDPFLKYHPAYAGNFDEMIAGTTHVLLTHGHEDHVGDTVEICAATGAELVSSPEVCGWLALQGVASINPGNIGGTIDCGAFKVSFTDATHSSSMIVDGKMIYLGPAMGLVIRAANEPTLYHMGDTGLFGDMALIDELYHPEIGIVPIGDRFTMDARQAAIACKRFFHFDTVIPAHYATFPLLAASADELVRDLAGTDTKVQVLGYGAGAEFTGAR
ncbi:metal-dependent hydrolase [Ancylobacter sp. Lp-2]|uniref:metal-dependent hydrolase n=1 Tax=Ancylobacter sp. Lp-2 TaxID=2881339 RepID=UPI001E41948D|nr:metal-dependent hydrolase [Ancylobacter sp. Lp-2]MCB4767266.1 metal-dependent hydrolase [Ancylobacter sp. Lp-2]